jgi:hypothetical protein
LKSAIATPYIVKKQTANTVVVDSDHGKTDLQATATVEILQTWLTRGRGVERGPKRTDEAAPFACAHEIQSGQ